MELPDIFKGLKTIGKWETFWWGCRWELTNSEIEKALAKLDVERNVVAVFGAGLSFVLGAGTAGLAAPVIGGFTALTVGLYELLKARIKSVNQGNGVIVDFVLDYSKSKSMWRFLAPRFNPVALGLNISNVNPTAILVEHGLLSQRFAGA